MKMEGTTILAVAKDGKVAIGGDGQVTLGNTVFKSDAKKVRRLYNEKVIVGFAGSTADAFTLFEKFETFLETYHGEVKRSAVELAKLWRSDKVLRKLEAMMLAADKNNLLMISGNGDVMQPEHNIISIGSGGPYAYAAALAFSNNKKLSAKEIVDKSLEIAANICIYTNHNITVEELS